MTTCRLPTSRRGRRWSRVPTCSRSASIPTPVRALTSTIGTPSATDRDGLGQGSEVVDEIDLVEHDDRVCPALPDRGQVALDPPRIEIAVGRGDEAEDVDIGRDHLRGGVRVGRAADHGRAAPQDVVDDGALGVVGYGDPVADGRAIDTGELVAQPAGELSEPCLASRAGDRYQRHRRQCGLERVRGGSCSRGSSCVAKNGPNPSSSSAINVWLLSEVAGQATSDGAFGARVRPDSRGRESGRCLCADEARSRGVLAGAAVGGSDG